MILASFSNGFLSGKKYSLVENSCLPIFPDDKTKTLADFLTQLYWSFVPLFCYRLFFICLTKSYFKISSSSILMDYLIVILHISLKMKMVLWYNPFKLHKTFKFSIRWIIGSYLLKFSLVTYFYDTLLCRDESCILRQCEIRVW